MDASQMAIVPLARADENALIEGLGQLRREASARPPGASPSAFGWGEPQWSSELPLRAAVVAASCEEVASRAELLESHLARSPADLPTLKAGAVAARGDGTSSIGLLFPGQGSPAPVQLGALGGHVPSSAALHRGIELPSSALPGELTQLAIVASSLAVLHTLEHLGVEADFSLGHSLGELVALHWAGAYDRETLVEMARVRGRAMTLESIPGGAMAAIAAAGDELPDLLAGEEVTIACFNAPRQHVVSGRKEAIEAICERARARRRPARRLEVTGAFHSPLMTPAARVFAEDIATFEIGTVRRPVVSTVTGNWLRATDEIRPLLIGQLNSPVRFRQAVEHAAGADLMIEAGPGKVLSRIVRESVDTPVVSLPADGDERDFLQGIAALWACGVLRRPATAGELWRRAISPV